MDSRLLLAVSVEVSLSETPHPDCSCPAGCGPAWLTPPSPWCCSSARLLPLPNRWGVPLRRPPGAGLQQGGQLDHPVPLRRPGPPRVLQEQPGPASAVLLRRPQLPHADHTRVQPLQLRDHLAVLRPAGNPPASLSPSRSSEPCYSTHPADSLIPRKGTGIIIQYNGSVGQKDDSFQQTETHKEAEFSKSLQTRLFPIGKIQPPTQPKIILGT